MATENFGFEAVIAHTKEFSRRRRMEKTTTLRNPTVTKTTCRTEWYVLKRLKGGGEHATDRLNKLEAFPGCTSFFGAVSSDFENPLLSKIDNC